jgi:hypothetical protein
MSNDKLFQWWIEYKYPDFKKYMVAWTSNFNKSPEDHSDERVRIDRAISYIDSIDSGFIKQYLLIQYQMGFVEAITARYWAEATEE